MSTFGGRMREYSCISLDRYNGANLESTVYFLSHNHSDHTEGLDSIDFAYRLKGNNHIKLYCSEVTKGLVLTEEKFKYLRDRNLKDAIVGIPMETPTEITIPDPVSGLDQQKVMVTLLPAGHCPGSVMFLFEGKEGTVLYTGDIRLENRQLQEMKHLRSGDRVKEIKSLYIDTTFCVPEAVFIPSREHSVAAVLEIAGEWLSKGPKHMVLIHHKANLGYEYLFMKLFEAFKMQVHVSEARYRAYESIGEMTKFATTDPSNTQIHACKWMSSRKAKSNLPCGFLPEGESEEELQVRVITVSTMCFVKSVATDIWAIRKHEKLFKVCYSFHCSMSEIRDVITYLQPQRVFPNVVPNFPQPYTEAQMQERLNRMLEGSRQSTLIKPPSESVELGQLRKRRRKMHLQASQGPVDYGDFDFGDLDDEPTPKKNTKPHHNANGDLDLDQKAGGDHNSPEKATKSKSPKKKHKSKEQAENGKHEEDDDEDYDSEHTDKEGASDDEMEFTEDDFKNLDLKLWVSQDDIKSIDKLVSSGNVMSYDDELEEGCCNTVCAPHEDRQRSRGNKNWWLS